MEEKVKVKDLQNQECEEQQWGYYSRTLKKDFDTLSDLKAAEAEYEKELASKKAKVEERKADAEKVEEALKHFYNVKREAFQQIKEAEDAYYTAKDNFINKYGSYHATYSNTNGEESVKVSDFFDRFFGDLFKVFES